MCDCIGVPKPMHGLEPPGWSQETIVRGALAAVTSVTLAKALVPRLLETWVPLYPLLRFVPSLVLLVGLVSVVVIFRSALIGTCALPSTQLPKTEIYDMFSRRDINAEERIRSRRFELAKRLATALTFKTISCEPDPTSSSPSSASSPHKTDYREFDKLHAYLRESFPRVFRALEVNVVNKYSLVLVWRGSDPSQQPYMLTAHMDVVPAPEPEKWSVDPFAGEIKDGYVWGRGAIDDKQCVLGWLEAVDDLLQQGFKPTRSVYLAFGHDEEISGFQGAGEIAKWCAENVGARDCFEFVMDEGLFIIDGAVPGHKKPVAFICTAEKGYISVELSVETPPGHSSNPPRETAIGILSQAVKRIENNPMPAYFDGPARSMFTGLVDNMATALKVIIANLWLFSPLMKLVFGKLHATNTLVRTTSALTIFNAGVKDNVIPSTARAIVNHRVHPFDSLKAVLEWDRKIVNDPRVKLRPFGSPVPPAPVSSADHPAFGDIRKAVYQVHADSCVVTPGLFVAASDSRHYWNLTGQIYRFNPICLHMSETSMFHGFNERISIDNYAELVLVFRNVILNANARAVPIPPPSTRPPYETMARPTHEHECKYHEEASSSSFSTSTSSKAGGVPSVGSGRRRLSVGPPSLERPSSISGSSRASVAENDGALQQILLHRLQHSPAPASATVLESSSAASDRVSSRPRARRPVAATPVGRPSAR